VISFFIIIGEKRCSGNWEGVRPQHSTISNVNLDLLIVET